MDEHGTKSDQPMYAHLTNCAQFYDIDAINTVVSKELHLHIAVTENTEIIDHNDNWAHL